MFEFSNSEKEIVSILLENDVLYTIKDLATELGLSNRAIYYNISNISKKLIKNKIEPPRNIRGQGYYFSEKSKQKVKHELNTNSVEKINLDSETRRAFLIFLMLIDSKINSISKMAKIMNVTKNTILNDQKVIALFFEKYNVDVIGDAKGHHVLGKESNIRAAIQAESKKIAFSLFRIRHGENKLMELEEVRVITNLKTIIKIWLENIEQNSFLNFTDDGKNYLENYYMIVLMRILNGNQLKITEIVPSQQDQNRLKKQNEFEMASELLSQLGLQYGECKGEVFFLESLLLGTQKNEVGFSGEENVKSKLKRVTKEVVDNFKKLSGMRTNNEAQLLSDLYTHFLSAFYRIKYHHQYTDGMVTQVKNKYFNVYTYTKMSLQPFEKLNVERLNENEISLIAIYFGSQMLQQNKGAVLLVCSAGLGTSRLLKEEILAHFPTVNIVGPITKSEYNNISKIEYSLVISTTPLNERGTQVIQLSPILTLHDLSMLKKLFIANKVTRIVSARSKYSALMDIISDTAKIKDYTRISEKVKEILAINSEENSIPNQNKYPHLSDLLTHETVKFTNEKNLDWQMAIEEAAHPLIRSNKIDERYVNAMIRNVRENGPYINIGKMIALAHAKPEEGVNDLGMTLFHLSNPVYLVDKNHPIKLFFVLAAVDEESHVNAMSELAALLGDEDKLNELIKAQNFKDIEKIILKEEI
ncbi:PTS sugar transporter subunit IIA [Pediococcus pentosaceus]|uniref:BglG family transcription antiterminator n=1 Tax=Pediococcus pentosaceus TaxID=1255 RepID=UPI002FF3C7A0